ncbi:PhzF family phenazine biosynthesis protein [Luteolibacter sp. SL250]|uniref:PhzF family phenazine biosynthesis protein n=1 Tax=Luteolibacter sp. SL250 TaxID=2995170 RepID=UPI002270E111|nr:PhzF family phenazine biosynthesis protein [Luteolibacter sp. SL250]WAC19007.1 PhzF family phenazine biosynthesis protein [Luteolibacter sp. SL250]
MNLEFLQVDAFSRRALFGNPAAVVFGADDALPQVTMQRIAREMNLSETVFLFPPTSPAADYRVRIFTPRSELPFAGHPTLAAARAVQHRFPELRSALLLRQECGIGIVPVEVSGSGENVTYTMTQATPAHRPVDPGQQAIAEMLGCAAGQLPPSPPEVVSTGVNWLIVELDDFSTVASLRPDFGLISASCASLGAVGMTVFARAGSFPGLRLKVRTFAPGEGVMEDPVCGSGNGSVAAYLARHCYPEVDHASYLAQQGREIDRTGEVEVSWTRRDGEVAVKVGGATAISASGEIFFDADPVQESST